MRILMAVVAVALALAPAADAATPIERWAKTNKLSGHWKTKDTDRDGVKNRREFALKTNPRKADSDRDKLRDGDEVTVGTDPRKPDTDGDGTRDGAENAGRIRAYDGETVTIDRFVGGRVTALVSESSQCLDEEAEEEAPADEEYVEVTEDATTGDPHWAEEEVEATEEEDPPVDLGGDDDYGAGSCTDPDLKPGTLVTSAVIADGVALDIDVKS
ncbi:hypothetical protein OJ997_02210 [Solirubrobacter phytolaccae]|uniref:Uncharacterized protein n=1 Tax=Solirubrobacter phytolaccae TaxID=1404360 RepID=A0A9X3N6B2_9ACTN|nr:hypothetical protein [Solirubrobacter phytolaccae]MDA0179094.1 hypothetical protein [Solirubrobacter phytolaccae]